jgi:hypothetical protein
LLDCPIRGVELLFDEVRLVAIFAMLPHDSIRLTSSWNGTFNAPALLQTRIAA